MNLNLHILGEFSRKAFYVALTLLIGLSMSAGSVLANSCKEGTACLICATAAHPHIPGMDVQMVNPGCQSAEQNSSCGFETGRNADKFDKTTAVVKSGTQPYYGIFSAASDESDQADLYREFIAQFQNPDRSELTPIYILNLSLLC